MNENAKRWVEALRSGEFDQTTHVLHDEDGYCCLGVACELYRREHPESSWVGGSMFEFRLDADDYGDDYAMTELPDGVRHWVGLTTSGGRYGDPTKNFHLTKDNDVEAKTFEQIADIIESEPDGLFA